MSACPGMVPRALSSKLEEAARSFPVVTVTGPRQSGKSTLVQHVFPDYRYISLEDPDMREAASDDPRSFLARFNRKAIIDEAQRVPELFSYMQGVVDRADEPGQYIVSGSQNFLLLKNISQSLAGRARILHLLPLSYAELFEAGIASHAVDDFLFKGGYPRLVSRDINPTDFFPSYVQTYVDRDVREEMGVRKVSEFNTFITLCATRIGEVLNLDDLARDCGIGVDAARSWLSILEASFLVFRLAPYYRNYGKRLVKSPKLYFYDTGLAASLLGIESAEQLGGSNHRGALFENAVAIEVIKRYQALGTEPKLFYWRDSNKNEVDFIIEKGGTPRCAVEVKSSATFRPKAFGTLDSMAPEMGLDIDDRFVIYGGSESFDTKHGSVLGLADLGELVRLCAAGPVASSRVSK